MLLFAFDKSSNLPRAQSLPVVGLNICKPGLKDQLTTVSTHDDQHMDFVGTDLQLKFGEKKVVEIGISD